MKFAQVARIEFGSSTNALALSRDGALVAVTSFDQKVRTYSTATMSLVKTTHLGTAFPHALCFSPDGRFVASGAKAIALFDTATWKKGVTLKGHRHEIQDATFSADGTRVYTGSGNGYTPSDWTARAWDAATGAQLWKWKSQREVYAVAASPDGRTVAAGDNQGVVTLLDADTGLPRWSTSVGAWVYCLRFTPDGASVIASGDAHQLAVLSAADGALRTIPMKSAARAFALTRDGATAIVGGTQYGEAVPLAAYDVATGKTLAKGPKVGRLPQGVELSPDDNRLYVLVNDPHELLVFEL